VSLHDPLVLVGKGRDEGGMDLFKIHISLWEHSSHDRLIGRGVPGVSFCFSLVYNFRSPEGGGEETLPTTLRAPRKWGSILFSLTAE